MGVVLGYRMRARHLRHYLRVEQSECPDSITLELDD
jgi:hypothetical protein